MGWVFRSFWNLVIFCAVLALIGSVALMLAFVSAAGPALGQGLYGGKVFVTGIAGGYQDAEAWDEAVQKDAEKKRAAAEKRAAQRDDK